MTTDAKKPPVGTSGSSGQDGERQQHSSTTQAIVAYVGSLAALMLGVLILAGGR